MCAAGVVVKVWCVGFLVGFLVCGVSLVTYAMQQRKSKQRITKGYRGRLQAHMTSCQPNTRISHKGRKMAQEDSCMLDVAHLKYI